MKLLNFIVIKLTICLAIGIALGRYLNINFEVSLLVTLALLITVGLYWFLLRRKVSKLPFFSLLVYATMICIGINTYQIKIEKLRPQHYTNINPKESYENFTLRIKERLKPDLHNEKYIVNLESFNGLSKEGQILINIRLDSSSITLPVDALIFANGKLQTIQKPLNPHQFDYSQYLELKQVYHQLYLDKNNIRIISTEPTSIYGFADQLRQHINTRLISSGIKDRTLSIINALLLGQRQSIDKTIYNNYVNSGTIHILAVSGLHVGIFLWILNFVFRPLLYLKYGRIIRPILLITILWLFAVIAGLSPSVTRAVTMFSVISIAMHLKRPTNIYNTLAISAFIILLFKPAFLFEVGFQLSYLAVLGIVSIQPLVYKLWNPRLLLTDKLWQIFTVTLAAQIGVAPISLYYFHQFPGLFFVSNLVVIPFLGIILGFGLLVIVVALINILPDWMVTIYSTIIDGLNGFIAWVAQFEDFLFRDIPFTLLQVVLCYLIIISFVQYYKFKSYMWLVAGLVGIISFQAQLFYSNYNDESENFIVFNKSRHTILGLRQNSNLLIHHNLDSTKQQTDKVIQNYKVGEEIDHIETGKLQSVYKIKNEKLVVIDSLGIYENLSFRPDYILLRDSPRINLDRLIDSLGPIKIIADASNYKSYVQRWKDTCIGRKIPFHYTNEKGAYIIK
jgi:competence protein ComEC